MPPCTCTPPPVGAGGGAPDPPSQAVRLAVLRGLLGRPGALLGALCPLSSHRAGAHLGVLLAYTHPFLGWVASVSIHSRPWGRMGGICRESWQPPPVCTLMGYLHLCGGTCRRGETLASSLQSWSGLPSGEAARAWHLWREAGLGGDSSGWCSRRVGWHQEREEGLQTWPRA